MGGRFNRSLRAVLAGSLLFGGAVTATVVGGATPAWAQPAVTLYVAPAGSGDCTSQINACGSLQTALTTATGGSYTGDDVTVDVAAGTYDENDIVDASSLDSLTIAGSGASSTILDGTESGFVLGISGGTVDISGVTVQNGSNGGSGGGILSCNSTSGCVVTVSDSTFTGDTAGGGGGAIDNGDNFGDGTLIVSDSTFTDDSAAADGRGGAIDNADNDGSGTVTVSDSTFTDDTAEWGGGAIANGNDGGDGSLSVTNSTFSGDTADLSNNQSSGGAIDNSRGLTTVTDSTFTDSQASNGGAINGSDNAYDGGSGTLAVSDSTFSGNSAAIDGGAIDTADIGGSGTTTISDSTFSGNTASSDGGAIDNADGGGSGTTSVTSSTLWGNWADGTGGSIDDAAGTVDLAATILSAAPTGDECSGPVTDEGYNIDDDGSCGLGATGSVGDSSTLDVTLGALKQNAGPTETMLPDSDSPAVGAIPNSTTLGSDTVCPTTDQQGVASAAGASCNIGATQSVATAPTITAVTFSGTPAVPTVTVQGSGFGTQADLGIPVPAYGSFTGSDYGERFFLLDGFGAGEGDGPFGDDVGVSISSYSNTQITFTFGSGYPGFGEADNGDSFSMTVLGTTFNGTVSYASPSIGGVTFGGDPTNPTVTVTGTGFGTLADLGSPTVPGGGGSGSDYSNNNFLFSDNTGSWQAGLDGNFVGLIISSYTNSQITFTFGNQYSVFGPVRSGDGFSMTVLGTSFNGTASIGTGFTCVVSGLSGTTSFPTVVSETPAPPTSIDAGGTFSTSPAARVTVPASVISHFIGMGATSLTIASQSTALDGRTAVGGALSGAVSPNAEVAAASDLPQSDPTLVAGTPYSYSTTYNPVTWQTGPNTGKVYFTPGDVDAEVTFVIHGTATPESISCTPPSGVAALGSTTVDPPPSKPTFQVPSSTPPLQNQVSAGTEGGWGATIANTSTATVAGLTAGVTVTDGRGVSFDLAGMAASGTNCSNAGAGRLTCSIGSLAPGATDSLDVLVETTGLPNALSITGSAKVSASNVTGSETTTLSTIGVVVVQAGNGTKAVATPGKALVSTKKPLKTAKASVSLTLPTKKITVTKKARSDGTGPTGGPLATGTITINPPPVAVTLESLAPSAEPALCPPTGNLKCEGNIIQVFGNFSLYTSNLHPIAAVVKFFYGLSVPKGTVYFLKPNGKTVDKLAACKKTASGYNTPCVFGKEVTGGTTGNKYAQDTVYFTGNDPAMGRR